MSLPNIQRFDFINAGDEMCYNKTIEDINPGAEAFFIVRKNIVGLEYPEIVFDEFVDPVYNSKRPYVYAYRLTPDLKSKTFNELWLLYCRLRDKGKLPVSNVNVKKVKKDV